MLAFILVSLIKDNNKEILAILNTINCTIDMATIDVFYDFN